MQKRRGDDIGAARIAKHGAAEVQVKDIVTFLHSRRYGIVEAKDNVPANLVAVVVREIAARVPAFCTHVAIVSDAPSGCKCGARAFRRAPKAGLKARAPTHQSAGINSTQSDGVGADI
jgi:hypothetical protein